MPGPSPTARYNAHRPMARYLHLNGFTYDLAPEHNHQDNTWTSISAGMRGDSPFSVSVITESRVTRLVIQPAAVFSWTTSDHPVRPV